jgi:hypothetical protein
MGLKGFYKFALLFSIILLSTNFISPLNLYLNPHDNFGSYMPNMTFYYNFNFTSDSSCTNVLLSSNFSITTNTYGNAVYSINLSGLENYPKYVCEYRGTNSDSILLRKVHDSPSILTDKIYTNELRVFGLANYSGILYYNNGTPIIAINTTQNIQGLSFYNKSETDNNLSLYYTLINSNNYLNITNIVGTANNNSILFIDGTNHFTTSPFFKYYLAQLNLTSVGGVAPLWVDGNIIGLHNMTLGDWLNGKWNGTSFDDWLSSNGNTWTFNSSKLNTIYFNASLVSTVAGTAEGNGGWTNYTYDGISYNVSEVATSPAIDVRFNYTGITNFNQILIRYHSDVGENHIMHIQLWDYSTATWENYLTSVEVVDYELTTMGVIDPDEHIQNGVVQLRFHQDSNGNINHKHYFDMVVIASGLTSLAGQEVDPLSFHKNTNVDINGYNITNISNAQGSIANFTTAYINNVNVSGNITLSQILTLSSYGALALPPCSATYNRTFMANDTGVYVCGNVGSTWTKI